MIPEEAMEAALLAVLNETYGASYSRDLVRIALTAAAPFIRAAAKREALESEADRFDARSETLLKTMQNMADSREYGPDDITRYGAFSAEANTTAVHLRARAAAVRGEG
jgi:hypothetical protein